MTVKQELTDYLNTAEAADFLGVSEASVRRWGDSGMYPMERVGQRRQRRFRRPDLVAFLEGSRQPMQPRASGMPSIGGAPVSPGTHVATFFASDAGRMRIAVPFLRDGVILGQPCFLIATGEILEGYIQTLEKDVKAELADANRRGLFVTAAAPGRTVKGALAYWEEQVTAAAANTGASVVRVVGDMACVSTSFPLQPMLTFEHLVGDLNKRLPSVMMCQYDVREFDGPSVLEAIKAHPDVFEVGLEKLVG